ncbi:MAG TPA: hypothetical protein VFV38_15815 [Ktedonobacteraceae bacterium]|nr:hypothetical protein [Ktedonobacteraceae bacterium]
MSRFEAIVGYNFDNGKLYNRIISQGHRNSKYWYCSEIRKDAFLMTMSEIARFKEQQAQQEEAARSGFSGPAIVARHDFIEARAEQGAERILQLLTHGRYEEAEQHMNLPNWGVTGREVQGMSHFDTQSL